MKRNSARKRSLAVAAILIPFLGHAMNFQEVSGYAYGVSGEMIDISGKTQAIGYERDSAMAGEPLSLEGSTRRIRAEDPNGNGMEYGMMVGLTMKTPGVKAAQYRQYDLRSKMLRSEQKRREGLIQVALKHDWLTFLLSVERVNILADKKEISEKAYAMGTKKFQAGRMSQMEVLRLETELKNAAQEYAVAAMESEHAQLRLKEATGLKEDVRVDDLAFSFIDADGHVEERIENSAAIDVLRVREEELNAEIELVRRSRVERVSMGLGMTQEPMQNSIDMKVAIPIVWSDKNEKKIAALMSERGAIVRQRDAALAKLRIWTYGSLEHLKERQQRIQELIGAEKNYETLFAMAHKGFEGGVVTQFEYLAAKNAFYDARLRSIVLKSEYVNEISAMEEKLGGVW